MNPKPEGGKLILDFVDEEIKYWKKLGQPAKAAIWEAYKTIWWPMVFDEPMPEFEFVRPKPKRFKRNIMRLN